MRELRPREGKGFLSKRLIKSFPGLVFLEIDEEGTN